MPILLETFQKTLYNRINYLNSAFERHLINQKKCRRIDKFFLQEGLVSSLWQTWSWFARQTIIASATGAIRTNGAVATSPYSQYSEQHITCIASQLSRRQTISRISALSAMRNEPTWGDLTKLNRIITGMNTSNMNELLSAFGAAIAISDLQKCRNANAHLNKETYIEIQSLRARYDETNIQHPSDMIFWVDPGTKDFLWKTWVDEIEIVSEFAVI